MAKDKNPGMSISDSDIASVRRAFGSQGGQGGRAISNADMARLQRFLNPKTGNRGTLQNLKRRNRRMLSQETGSTISDADVARIMQSIGMEDGGEAKPAAPIMPEKAKKIRKYRSTRNDKTSLPKQVRDFIAEQDGKEVKTYQNGGAVMAGRGGKFKGVS